MTPEQLFEFEELKRQVEDLLFQLARKVGAGSADIRGNIVQPSTLPGGSITAGSIDKAAIGSNAVGDSELDYELVTVTVLAAATSGTGTATSGSVILGWRPNGNIDQFVDSISISGTTVTVTLGAAATANCDFVVILIKV